MLAQSAVKIVVLSKMLTDGGIHMVKTAQKHTVIDVGKMGAACGMNHMIIVIS